MIRDGQCPRSNDVREQHELGFRQTDGHALHLQQVVRLQLERIVPSFNKYTIQLHK